MYLLYQHLEGNVKKAVEQLQYMVSASPEIAYTEARKKLKSRSGRPAIITADFENKLSNWPKIANNGVQGLREFSDFLYQVEIAMNRLHSLKIFKYPSKLHTLVEKPQVGFLQNGRQRYKPYNKKKAAVHSRLSRPCPSDRRDFIKKKNFDLSVWLTTSILPMIAIKNLQYATSAARNIFKCSVKTELHVEATPGRKGTPNTTNEPKLPIPCYSTLAILAERILRSTSMDPSQEIDERRRRRTCLRQ